MATVTFAEVEGRRISVVGVVVWFAGSSRLMGNTLVHQLCLDIPTID